jgi:hypothetical protein
MKAKLKTTPDLSQEIVDASANAVNAMIVAGRDIMDSYFGPRSVAVPPPAVRRTHVKPKKARARAATRRRK